MDQRVRVDKDGTLYLVGLSEQPIVQEKKHGLLYYAACFVLTVFMLMGIAIAALFTFLLILAFL